MTATDLGMAGRRGTGDAQLDDLLQRADAALRSALRAQRGRLDNKDRLAGHYIHHTPYNDAEVDIAAADCGPCGPCHANERGLDTGVNNIARTVAALRALGIAVDEPLWPSTPMR